MDAHPQYVIEAQHQWGLARRKAFWRMLSASVKGGDIHLRDFDEVSRRLHLTTPHYKGVVTVALHQIVGSIGRYTDFVAEFLPVTPQMEERWRGVAAAYLDPGRGVSPVELFKVGDAYFVKDGNHRVSVAVQLGLPDIEAYVWEYALPVEGSSDQSDIDALLIAAEQKDFLATTQLDATRPGHNLSVTLPGSWQDIMCEIAHYQGVLERIDGVKISYEEAATGWYDILYQATLGVIESSGILERFPSYTATDVYVSAMRHRAHLEEAYGKSGRMAKILHEVEESFPRHPAVKLWKRLRRMFRALPFFE